MHAKTDPVRPYHLLPTTEKARTLAHEDALLTAAEASTDPREAIWAEALRLGVLVWPALVNELEDKARASAEPERVRVSFGRWLDSQTGRMDAVGRAARFLKHEPRMPSDASFRTYIAVAVALGISRAIQDDIAVAHDAWLSDPTSPQP